MKQKIQHAGLIFTLVLIVILQLFTLLAVAAKRGETQTKVVTQKVYQKVYIPGMATPTKMATPSAGVTRSYLKR